MIQSVFTFPRERDVFAAHYWTVAEAAIQWGCTYKAARNYIARNPDIADRVLVLSPRGEAWRWAVPIGTVKRVASRGNPLFRKSSFQRSMANCRWDHQRRLRMFTVPSRPDEGNPDTSAQDTGEQSAFGVYRNGRKVFCNRVAYRVSRG